jgi:hypothetical protein
MTQRWCDGTRMGIPSELGRSRVPCGTSSTSLAGRLNPADSNDLYHDPADSFPNGGTKVDARPTIGGPGFSDPSSADYSLTTSFASDAIGFHTIDQIQMGLTGRTRKHVP